MSNLAEGIQDEVRKKVILNMHRLGYPLEEIAQILEKTEEEVQAILERESRVDRSAAAGSGKE